MLSKETGDMLTSEEHFPLKLDLKYQTSGPNKNKFYESNQVGNDFAESLD